MLGRRWVDKHAWLWTYDVKEKVREKKRLYHLFFSDKTVHNWRNYRESKKAAKKAVAAAEAACYADVSKNWKRAMVSVIFTDSPKLVVAKQKTLRSSLALTMRTVIFLDRRRAVKRWHDYFEEFLNVEFGHPAIPFASLVYGLVQKITVSETEAALRKVMSGKATGLDDLPADLWKSKS